MTQLEAFGDTSIQTTKEDVCLDCCRCLNPSSWYGLEVGRRLGPRRDSHYDGWKNEWITKIIIQYLIKRDEDSKIESCIKISYLASYPIENAVPQQILHMVRSIPQKLPPLLPSSMEPFQNRLRRPRLMSL